MRCLCLVYIYIERLAVVKDVKVYPSYLNWYNPCGSYYAVCIGYISILIFIKNLSIFSHETKRKDLNATRFASASKESCNRTQLKKIPRYQVR